MTHTASTAQQLSSLYDRPLRPLMLGAICGARGDALAGPREPEAVHGEQTEDRRRLDMPLPWSRDGETYRAALARARAEKRARRRNR